MSFIIADMLSGSPDYSGDAQNQEQQRQASINAGTSKINQAYSQFNPAYYQQRAQDYINYAMPQLQQQFQGTRNQQGFNVANRGLRGGSVNKQQTSDLARAFSGAQQGIADTGLAQSQQLQQQVEASRNALLGQLYQSADPASAQAQARNTAASFATPSTFAPLGNAFSSLSNAYNQYNLNNSYNQMLGQYGSSIPGLGVNTGVNPGALGYPSSSIRGQ